MEAAKNPQAQIKLVQFRSIPTKFNPQPSFLDRFMLITHPLLDIVQTQRMHRWVQMHGPKYLGLTTDFYENMLELSLNLDIIIS